MKRGVKKGSSWDNHKYIAREKTKETIGNPYYYYKIVHLKKIAGKVHRNSRGLVSNNIEKVTCKTCLSFYILNYVSFEKLPK